MTNHLKVSAEAAIFQHCLDEYTQQPNLIEPYKHLDEDDLLALVKGVGFDGAYAVNKNAFELGWVHPTSHGWTWHPDWLRQLKNDGNLAYFYVLVKRTNQNAATLRKTRR